MAVFGRSGRIGRRRRGAWPSSRHSRRGACWRPRAPMPGRSSPSTAGGVPAGTIVIRTSERALYLVDGMGAAMRYPVAVGQPGKQWFGWSQVDGKYVEPAWTPPYEVKRDNPRLPDVIPGGSPRNPMGAARADARPAANTRSTAPTARPRSAPSRPMAASGCTTRTSSTSSNASGSARGSWSSASPRPGMDRAHLAGEGLRHQAL